MTGEQIIFTVTGRKYGIRIKTDSNLADESDRKIDTVAVALASEMRRLSERYKAAGASVLFEVG